MRRHELDLFSLVTGVAFVSVAVLYLLDSAGVGQDQAERRQDPVRG